MVCFAEPPEDWALTKIGTLRIELQRVVGGFPMSDAAETTGQNGPVLSEPADSRENQMMNTDPVTTDRRMSSHGCYSNDGSAGSLTLKIRTL